jgi:hypothetical protein
MAAWMSVYCASSVSAVTAADILADLSDADVCTIAEGFGIEDAEAVGAAMAKLRIEPASDPQDVWLRLSVRPAEYRPVVIHRWSAPSRVETERAEALEQLDAVAGEGIGRVRSHLGRSVEVVGLELGWSQLDSIEIVLAWLVAEYLARVGQGLIRHECGSWWAMADRVPFQLCGPEEQRS